MPSLVTWSFICSFVVQYTCRYSGVGRIYSVPHVANAVSSKREREGERDRHRAKTRSAKCRASKSYAKTKERDYTAVSGSGCSRRSRTEAFTCTILWPLLMAHIRIACRLILSCIARVKVNSSHANAAQKIREP